MTNFTISETAIPGVQLVRPRKFRDDRGFFMETYSHRAFSEAGIDIVFVQDNHSLSVQPKTIRGLHFQRPPFVQDKLVRVVSGRIWDVVVDMRPGSPTFKHWLGVELSSDTGEQLLVPGGFAHGFLTLEPDTEVVYKVSSPYSPEYDGGVIWNDPDLAIDWPGLENASPVLSEKDKALPSLADLTNLAFL